MEAVTISPVLAAFISFVVAAISNFLRSRQLPAWQNGLIVFASMVIIAIFAAWLSNGFTSDLRQSVTLVVAFIVFLSARDAFALLDYLHAAPSPLQSKKRALWQPTMQYPVANRANTKPLERL